MKYEVNNNLVRGQKQEEDNSMDDIFGSSSDEVDLGLSHRILPIDPRNSLDWLTSKRRWTMDQQKPKLKKGKDRVWTGVIKSESDKTRDYRVFMLANEMRVIIISDPETDKSGAALSVQVGSMLDPQEICGMAHLCERMLFMVNEVDKNIFANFLQKNDGDFSSFTQRDLTTFLFDVSPLVFQEALERFSRQFVSPKFPENCLEEQIHEIHEEYKSRGQSDEERRAQVALSLTRAYHPYGQFDCGNRESLWTLPIQRLGSKSRLLLELLKFYKCHYSSNLMSLAVLGRESCEELQDSVTRLFSSVHNLQKNPPHWPDSPYAPEHLMTRIDLVPLDPNLRKLFLIFPIPDYTPHYKTGTIPYLRFLLGYQGPGSLLSMLKKFGWVSGVEVDYEQPGSGFAFLTLDFQLTSEGLDEVENIVHHFFQYMKMLRKEGPQRHLWDEMKVINETKFRFMCPDKPLNLVESLVSLMPIVPPNEILSCRYLLSDYKPQLIRELFNYLLPRNMRIIVSCKENQKIANEATYWYKAKYSYSGISEDLIQQWASCSFNDEFRFPPPNPFIATALDLKPRDGKSVGNTPQILEDHEFARVWYLQDNEYRVPKGTIILAIISPLPKQEALHYNLTRLMGKIIDDFLSEFTCAANAAGLTFNVEASIAGLTLTVHGYDQKLSTLLNYILNRVFHFCSYGNVGPHYDRIVEEYLEELWSWQRQEPYIHATEQVEHVLCNHSWKCDELIKAMKEKIPPEKLACFATRFFSLVKLQWFFHGNFTENEAFRIYKSGLEYFHCVKSKPLPSVSLGRLEAREVFLPEGTTTSVVELSCGNCAGDSATVILLQSDGSGTRQTVILELIETILYEPAVQLLTKRGHLVWTDVRKSRGTLGLQIVVQGPREPNILEESVENFLTSMTKNISKLTQETFLQHCITLAVRKTKRSPTFWDRSVKIFQEIFAETYEFESQQLQLQEIHQVTRKEISDFYNDYIAPSGKRRRKLCIKVSSTSATTTEMKPVKMKNFESLITELPIKAKTETSQNSLNKKVDLNNNSSASSTAVGSPKWPTSLVNSIREDCDPKQVMKGSKMLVPGSPDLKNMNRNNNNCHNDKKSITSTTKKIACPNLTKKIGTGEKSAIIVEKGGRGNNVGVGDEVANWNKPLVKSLTDEVSKKKNDADEKNNFKICYQEIEDEIKVLNNLKQHLQSQLKSKKQAHQISSTSSQPKRLENPKVAPEETRRVKGYISSNKSCRPKDDRT